MSIEIYPKKSSCFCINAQKVLFLTKNRGLDLTVMNKLSGKLCASCTHRMAKDCYIV